MCAQLTFLQEVEEDPTEDFCDAKCATCLDRECEERPDQPKEEGK